MSHAQISPETSAATTGSGSEDHQPHLLPRSNQRLAVPAAQITELNHTYLTIIKLMTEGFDAEGRYILGQPIQPNVPLTLFQAAQAVGQKPKRAREMLRDCKAFQTALNAAMVALRRAESPRNLRTAIAIRDDEGDQSAATKTVRLKAIQSIEGTDRNGVNVQVNVSNQTNVAPGYVIRLPAKEPPEINATAQENSQ